MRQKVLPVWNSLLCWERWRCVIISVLAAFSVTFTIQLCVARKKYVWINFEIWVLASGLVEVQKKSTQTYFLEQILWRVNWRNQTQVLTSGFKVYSRCELQSHLSTTRSPWGKKKKNTFAAMEHLQYKNSPNLPWREQMCMKERKRRDRTQTETANLLFSAQGLFMHMAAPLIAELGREN